MRSSEIVTLLREQFRLPGHSLEMGRPEDDGSMTAVYEIYPDGGRTLWARFDSSSDAEAVVTAINEACARMTRVRKPWRGRQTVS